MTGCTLKAIFGKLKKEKKIFGKSHDYLFGEKCLKKESKERVSMKVSKGRENVI